MCVHSPIERYSARAQREGWPTFCDEHLAFTATQLTDLANIWSQVRGARMLPMRAAFLPAWHAAYDLVLVHRAPLRFAGHHRAFHLEHMSAESFVAPLGDDGGQPNGILMSTVYGARG